MDWRTVESTAIAEVGFDAARQALGVRFRSGETYVYAGVDAALFEAFLGAESKGRFFQDHVRDRYPYRRQPGE